MSKIAYNRANSVIMKNAITLNTMHNAFNPRDTEVIICILLVLLQTADGINSGAYLRKIAHMASTKIAFYIYLLLIISPGIHVYVY